VLGLMARPAVGGLRWIAPEQLHVTLVFLGEVAAPAVDPLVEALCRWASEEEPTIATIGPATQRLGLGVLCVPVRGLDAVAGGARVAGAEFGTAPNDPSFTGHLTLARAGRGAIPDEVVGVPVTADWDVLEVRLVASTLGSSGARYEPVALIRLGG